jgi:hypothetical protein
MKKNQYIKPEYDLIDMETDGFLAASSLKLNEEEIDNAGKILGREFDFDDEEE